MTKVIFYLEGEDVLAYFPDLVFDQYGFNGCYPKYRQDAKYTEDYFKSLKEAEYSEYQFLLADILKGHSFKWVSPKDLLILNSQTFNYMRNPTQAEILFGHGATHYRDFTLAEIGLNKQGKLKCKFKADDNLFYHL